MCILLQRFFKLIQNEYYEKLCEFQFLYTK